MLRWLRCLMFGVVFPVWGVILAYFGYLFLTFWGFGGEVGSGCEQIGKRDPGNQKKVLRVHIKTMFFLSRFPSYFLECSEEAFY